jgi:formylglycine-generating enzyme required for sulfatase activity/tRNA A-37 threonylcarbamoyl transferase component Bud32
MSSLIGQSIGRYHILEQPGEGGMATVYKAYDTRLERDVAVKIIRRGAFPLEQLDSMLKRFEREAKALARLMHPNIVGVIDYGEYKGSPYLVMPYLPGGTLKEKLGQPMPWQEAVRLLLPVAQALEYAHAQNIIHRDIKPSNILLTSNGLPMLSDFGIAKILDTEAGQTLTGTGVGVGTPEYMAPEQWVGKVTPQSDIYSLGVVFYEMLTGRKPYTADTPAAVLIKQTNDPLPPPRQFVPGLPEAVEKILFKALTKKPEDRYLDMAAFGRALEGLVSGQPISEAQPAAEKPHPTLKHPKEEDIQAAVDQMANLTVPSARIERGKHIPEATKDQPSGSPKPAEYVQSARLLEGAPSLPARRPSSRKVWVIVLIVLGLAVLSFLGTRLVHNPVASVNSATPTYPPTSTPGIGSTWTRPADGMVMVYVPEGEFPMGSPDDTFSYDEHPQHTASMDAFWIDQTEVTNAMYAACVKAGNCQKPHESKSNSRALYYGNSQFDNYPVIDVDWYQASSYCQWAGAHLPTEAQWEKAARGTDKRTYPWGDDSPSCSLANYWGGKGNISCVGDTSKVGSYPSGASPYGALDMAGNVWEWTADWYDSGYYPNSPSSNPTGSSSGQYRVLRGGSWLSIGDLIRSADRYSDVPDSWLYSIGFRCSRLSP